MTPESKAALNEYRAAIETAFEAARKLSSIRKTDDDGFPYRKQFPFPYVTIDGQLDGHPVKHRIRLEIARILR